MIRIAVLSLNPWY